MVSIGRGRVPAFPACDLCAAARPRQARALRRQRPQKLPLAKERHPCSLPACYLTDRFEPPVPFAEESSSLAEGEGPQRTDVG
jgi:hypothetical protein